MCFEMSVERSVLKIYCPESLLSFVSKFFEKLGSSRYFDYLVEFFFFRIFNLLVFWQFWLVELPGFLSLSGPSLAATLDISMAFYRFGYADRHRKCRCYEISVYEFVDGKSSQDCTINVEVP